MGKDLVLVGGGHAHLTVLVKIQSYVQRGYRVTVVTPSPYQYYSGMGPGMLSGIYRPQEVQFNIRKMAEDRGGKFVEGKVVRIDPAGRTLFLQSQEQVRYDVVSFNTGSEVPINTLLSGSGENIIPVKPVVNLLLARHSIPRALKGGALNLLVVGAGPAGVEVSANLWRLVKESRGEARITLIAGGKVLRELPDSVRKLALDSFSRRDIGVLEGNRVKEVKNGSIRMADGKSLPFDFAFLALGVRPSPLFGDSGLPTGEDGGLQVNPFLQCVAYPEIFGGGDCISFAERPLSKVGVYAVRQNPILFQNLLGALEGREMRVFTPQKDYLLILNMGNGRGILRRKDFVWEGRLAFLLKDYIDRKFMKKFQVSGERNEGENQ
jgi:NADH dehydrogenase FAD-containing subunit